MREEPIFDEGLTQRSDIVLAVEHFLSFELARTGEDEIKAVYVTSGIAEGFYAVQHYTEGSSVTVIVHPADTLNMLIAHRDGHGLARRPRRTQSWGDRIAPKEARVAADIEKKTVTRTREEWHVPTPGGFWGDGAHWTDVMLAVNHATNRLVELGKVPHTRAEPASDQIKIKPSDEHVIVFIEFDEEQK